MREKLQSILDTYDELTAKLGDPAVLGDQKEYTRLAKAHSAQAPLAEKAREYISASEQLDEAKEILKHETDPEM
ncbi:MAG: PCRF domain-containing protein, partial [Coriobacteriia bacterium]|nr:PCRF domain-containing protein [Coriobacteriia bacterium]